MGFGVVSKSGMPTRLLWLYGLTTAHRVPIDRELRCGDFAIGRIPARTFTSRESDTSLDVFGLQDVRVE